MAFFEAMHWPKHAGVGVKYRYKRLNFVNYNFTDNFLFHLILLSSCFFIVAHVIFSVFDISMRFVNPIRSTVSDLKKLFENNS